MHKFKKNLISSYLTNFSNILFQLIFIKLIISLIGIEQYGKYAFLVTILSILLMFDLGVSQYIIAKLREMKTKNDVKKFFEGVENSYFVICGSIFLLTTLILLFVKLIYPNHLINNYISFSLLFFIFFNFLFSGINSLYKSVFISIGLMVRFNKIQLISNFFKYIFIFFIIYLFQNLEAIFCWIAICLYMEFFFKRKLAAKYLGINFANLSFEKFKDSFFYFIKLIQKTYYLSLASWLGVLIMQIDKLYLSSKELPIIYGLYNIATLIGFVFLQLSYPVITSLQHKLIDHKFNPKELVLIYKKIFNVYFFVFASFILGYFFFLKYLLHFFIESQANIDMIYSISLPIIFGSLLNSVYNCIYQIWIARNLQKIIFYLNSFILFLLVIFLPKMNVTNF